MEYEIYHHGIKGQKWGVRRYQNKNGTLTPAGKKRLAKNEAYRDKLVRKAQKRVDKHDAYAKEAKRNIADLKKHGVNSDAYKRWKEEEYRKREREYEEKNKIKDSNGNEYVKKYSTSGSRFANDLFDGLFSDATVKQLIDENKTSAKLNKERAKHWAQNKSALMDMDINALTKKREIRSTYWLGGK